jgi:hypothetical protein
MFVPCREFQQATSCSLSGSCRLPACCCFQQQCWARLRRQQQPPSQHCLQRCSQKPLTASGDLATTVCGAHRALALSQTASSVSQAAGLAPLAVLTARLASTALLMAPAAQSAQLVHSGKPSKPASLLASYLLSIHCKHCAHLFIHSCHTLLMHTLLWMTHQQ